MSDKRKVKSIEIIVNDDIHKKRYEILSIILFNWVMKPNVVISENLYHQSRMDNVIFRLVHKNVGADQCTNMLMKLEEDAEVAYKEYDEAVKAEDRAEMYIAKVNEIVI